MSKHASWLVKEEPENYNFEALIKDGRTTWTGVKNPVAQKHLRAIRQGDRVFFYHTGKEKSVVGIARAMSDAYPDSKDKSGKLYAFDLGPVKRLKKAVTLAAIKTSGNFETFPLVRMSRLSVMPVTEAEWAAIERMSEAE
jgi:predicted RNA-binding protein with PUA-like domain